MPIEKELVPLRSWLIRMITEAVHCNNDCIGTAFFNIGTRYTVCSTENAYEILLIVNSNSDQYKSYGGYSAASVYDL